MEVKYQCAKCKTSFIIPLIDEGKFVCPSCENPDFDTIECKKYMHDCFV